jgi:hypothetical protein
MRTTNKRKTNGRKKYVRKNTHKKQSKNHSGIHRSEAKDNCKYKKTRRTGKKRGGQIFVDYGHRWGDYDEQKIVEFIEYFYNNQSQLFKVRIVKLNSLFNKFSQIIQQKYGMEGDSSERSDGEHQLSAESSIAGNLDTFDIEFMSKFRETRLSVVALYEYIKTLHNVLTHFYNEQKPNLSEAQIYRLLEEHHFYQPNISRYDIDVIKTVFSKVKTKYQDTLQDMTFEMFITAYRKYLDEEVRHDGLATNTFVRNNDTIETLFDILKDLGFRDEYIILNKVFDYLKPSAE